MNVLGEIQYFEDMLANSINEFDSKIRPWVISDDPNVLLGPEIQVCMHYINEWVGTRKQGENNQSGRPFNTREYAGLDNQLFRHNCLALTKNQRTAEGCTL